MTPEEAIPRRAVINGITPMDSQYTEFFTAKETAEIAKAYAQACLVCDDKCSFGCNHLSNCRDYWRKNVKEWSK